MKKLSLKNLNLEATDKLQRDQLKTVFGGYYSNEVLNVCGSNCSQGTCSAGVDVCGEFMSSCNNTLVVVNRCVNTITGEIS